MLRTSPATRIYRQCQSLSHRSLSKRFQNLTHRCPFSTTPLSLVSEQESQTSRPVDDSQNLSSSLPKVEVDEEKNSTAHALPGDGDTARASDNASNSSHTNTTTPGTHDHDRTTRSLRPIIFAPSSPSSQLLSDVPNIETTTLPTIALSGLPPYTRKVDIDHVFRRFGKITRIDVQPDERRADVVFSHVNGVKRTLHVYAERPLYIMGREIIVFRKHAKMMDTPLLARRTEQGHDDRTISVTSFPSEMTEEELLEAIGPLGKYEQFVMKPGSECAYFTYSDKNHVKEILSVHQRVPITVRGQILHIGSTEDRPSLSPDFLGDAVELGKPLDPETRNAIVKGLLQTVPGFQGTHEPSPVLWVGLLPPHFSRSGLTNFWSRLGCVVQVRTSLKGYAHVQFATVEDALRAVHHGVPNGFTHKQHLLNINFSRAASYAGAPYCTVYISGWSASHRRAALIRWASDIRGIIEANILPPFRGERFTDPRSAVLRFETLRDARAALHTLNGRVGPSGETLDVNLSRPLVVQPHQLWQWVYREKVDTRSGVGQGDVRREACLENEWEGFGFGTGEEERDDVQGVEG